jgi:hypothetical protein
LSIPEVEVLCDEDEILRDGGAVEGGLEYWFWCLFFGITAPAVHKALKKGSSGKGKKPSSWGDLLSERQEGERCVLVGFESSSSSLSHHERQLPAVVRAFYSRFTTYAVGLVTSWSPALLRT